MTEQHPGDQRPYDETSPLSAQPAAPAATAAPTQPPPHPGAYGEPQPPKRRFRDRLRSVPRVAWLSAAAVVVVVGVGVGGFLVGRATAPDGGGDFPDRGQRPDFPGGDGQMPGQPGQGMPGQQTQPGAGTDSGTNSGTDSGADESADTTAWYVVPQAS